jgi:hypothetical protein
MYLGRSSNYVFYKANQKRASVFSRLLFYFLNIFDVLPWVDIKGFYRVFHQTGGRGMSKKTRGFAESVNKSLHTLQRGSEDRKGRKKGRKKRERQSYKNVHFATT